jgi:hypothetical protein
MDNSIVVKHPLDQFSFAGTVGDLGPEGRASLEMLMQLIGDMKFLRGSGAGACARYFLLVDSSWVPKLCVSANINCVKLREHLWQYELGVVGESQDLADDRQIALPFVDAQRDTGEARDLSPESGSQLNPPDRQSRLLKGSVMAEVERAMSQFVAAVTSASKPHQQFGGTRYRTS